MLTILKVAGVALVCVACGCTSGAVEITEGKKKLRSMKYTPRTEGEAIIWQKDLRRRLFRLLKLDREVSAGPAVPLRPQTTSSQKRAKYVFKEMEIDTTPRRRRRIILTLPLKGKGPFPAVVAIGGHSSTRHTCYGTADKPGWAHVLAERGFVTISTRISQHGVAEKGHVLMGQRLWDLMRCVDFLTSLEEVDSQRIGCGGLSLGGEMAMWLGAMDERIRATVSSGFLTRMDQLEKNHCKCWKFPGLRELVDFADIYSLTAPRALLCQNGLKERPTWLTVPIAREALKDIKLTYADFKRPENLVFVAHEGGHELHLPSLLTFFEKHLSRSDNGGQPGTAAAQDKPFDAAQDK